MKEAELSTPHKIQRPDNKATSASLGLLFMGSLMITFFRRISCALGSDQLRVAEFSLDLPWKCVLQESPPGYTHLTPFSEMAGPRELWSSFRLPQCLFLGFFLGNLIPLLSQALHNSDFILMRWGKGSLDLNPSIHLRPGLGDWSMTSLGQSAPHPGQ